MQKFDTPAPISAVLDIPAGRVQFIAADRADTARRGPAGERFKGRDVKAAEQTTVEYADGSCGSGPAKNQYLGSSGSIEVTVKLPAGSRVEAKTAACELRGVGRLGDVVFEGAYRQIKIDEAASVRLTATDGDVEIGRLAGTRRSAPHGATSGSPTPYAARSSSAPSTATSRSTPPPASRPPSTPAPATAGSATP